MACLSFFVRGKVDYPLFVRNVCDKGRATITESGVYVEITEYKIGVDFETELRAFSLVGASEDIVNFVVKTGGIDHFCKNSKHTDNAGLLTGCGVNNYTEMCYFNDNPEWYFFGVEAQQDELDILERKIKFEYTGKYIYTKQTGRWGSLDAFRRINPEWVETPAATLLIKLRRMAQERLAHLTRKEKTSCDRLMKIKHVSDLKKVLGN